MKFYSKYSSSARRLVGCFLIDDEPDELDELDEYIKPLALKIREMHKTDFRDQPLL